MTAWLDILNKAWSELEKNPPISREFRTKLVSENVSLNVFAAIRASDDAPCLTLQSPIAAEALFELGGMRLQTFTDETGPNLVLSLEDRGRRDLFSTICADVVGAAAITTKGEALDQFLARLDAWRQFLRDRRDGLSRSDVIGLLGELVILDQLLDHGQHSLAMWKAPNDGLHDFESKGHALEVKTGLGPTSTITISKLDQLDIAGTRRLDLLVVRLIEALEGRSLGDMISSVASKLESDSSRRSFENALLRRGLMPDDEVALNSPRVQLRTIDAYSIEEEFPRLVRALVPVGILEATYSLDLRSILAFAKPLDSVIGDFLLGGHDE